jgi:hypothetical protein
MKLRTLGLALAALVLAGAVELRPSWGQGAQMKPIVIPAISFTAEGGGKVSIRTQEEEVTPAYLHLWHTAGHWLQWTIEGAEAGQYTLTLRYGEKFSTRRELQLDGRPVTGLEGFTLDSTGGWTDWKEVALPARVALQQGQNVLRLTCLDETSLCLAGLTLAAPGRKPLVIDPARFSGQGGGKVQALVSDQGGFFFNWDDKGHWLEWTVDNAPAGQYDVFLRCTTLDRPTREMKVNGEVVKGLESFTIEPSGGWRNWVEVPLPAKAALRAGRNVIRLTNLGGSLNMTSLRLSAPGQGDIIINAVDFTAQEGGKVRVVAQSRHGYFNHWDDKGHWLQWTVNAPVAGRYDVTLRYAAQQQSPREVRVNGEAVRGLEAVVLDRTPTWNDWREAKLPAPVTLRQGENLLRLTNLAEGGLNLDEIRLTLAAR